MTSYIEPFEPQCIILLKHCNLTHIYCFRF